VGQRGATRIGYGITVLAAKLSRYLIEVLDVSCNVIDQIIATTPTKNPT
jgi:hypothetical protein